MEQSDITGVGTKEIPIKNAKKPPSLLSAYFYPAEITVVIYILSLLNMASAIPPSRMCCSVTLVRLTEKTLWASWSSLQVLKGLELTYFCT